VMPLHRKVLAGCVAILSAGALRADGTEEISALLARSLELRCGPEQCADLIEIRCQGTVIYPSPAGDRVVPLAILARPASVFRLETGAGADRRVRSLDGEQATETLAAGEPTQLDAASRAGLRRTLDADEAFLLGRARAGDLRLEGVEAAGPGAAPGRLPESGFVALKLLGSEGAPLRLVLPAGGGLPLRLEYEVVGGTGPAGAASEVYSDWRPVDGMLVPFEVTVWSGSTAVAVFKYDSVQVVRSPPAERPATPP